MDVEGARSATFRTRPELDEHRISETWKFVGQPLKGIDLARLRHSPSPACQERTTPRQSVSDGGAWYLEHGPGASRRQPAPVGL